LCARIAACRFCIREPRPERLFYEIVHHLFRGVIDSVAFSLRKFRDCLAPLELSFPVLQLGNGLLEDMAKRIETEALPHVTTCRVIITAAKVEQGSGVAFKRSLVGALPGAGKNMVGNAQSVDERVWSKQSAIDLRQRHYTERAAAVHQREQSLEEAP